MSQKLIVHYFSNMHNFEKETTNFSFFQIFENVGKYSERIMEEMGQDGVHIHLQLYFF